MCCVLLTQRLVAAFHWYADVSGLEPEEVEWLRREFPVWDDYTEDQMELAYHEKPGSHLRRRLGRGGQGGLYGVPRRAAACRPASTHSSCRPDLTYHTLFWESDIVSDYSAGFATPSLCILSPSRGHSSYFTSPSNSSAR